METRDHLQLVNWLLLCRGNHFSHAFAAGLRIGSVLPDCNPLTYMRGIREGQGLYGHNAEITMRKISGIVSDLSQPQEMGFLYGLRLGTALHYLADAFTYPHHAYYPGTLADHVAYERTLHGVFTDFLTGNVILTDQAEADFTAYLCDMLVLYRKCRKSEYSDCRFITRMCHAALETVLRHQKNEDEVRNENSDYIRPVSVVR